MDKQLDTAGENNTIENATADTQPAKPTIPSQILGIPTDIAMLLLLVIGVLLAVGAAVFKESAAAPWLNQGSTVFLIVGIIGYVMLRVKETKEVEARKAAREAEEKTAADDSSAGN